MFVTYTYHYKRNMGYYNSNIKIPKTIASNRDMNDSLSCLDVSLAT